MAVTDLVRFTEGDCHILAIEISKRTGWPVMSVDGLHACVQMPDGRLLDVRGAHTPEEMAEMWSVDPETIFVYEDTHENMIHDWWVMFSEKSFARAKAIAPKLIRDART